MALFLPAQWNCSFVLSNNTAVGKQSVKLASVALNKKNNK